MMAEPKRVEFSTLTPAPETTAHSQKNSKKQKQTVRISLVLPESTEDTCPEFNYRNELLSRAKDNSNNKEPKNPILLDDDDDADVRRIAQEMEEKYGTSVPGNRRKRKRDDYADIGMGYDESDSFIDNTDGYDEIIPQNVTTVLGGFYINCGALEFKTNDEASSLENSSSSEDIPTTTKRKRIAGPLSDDTSSEDEDETKITSQDENTHKKPKMQSQFDNILAMKKKLLGSKMQVKTKNSLQKKTVKEILREKRKDLNMSDLKESSVEGVEVGEKKSSTIAETIESVVKAVSDTTENGTNDIIFKQPVKIDDITATISEERKPSSTPPPLPLQQQQHYSQTPLQSEKTVSLPQNLPSDVLDLISTIRTLIEKFHIKGASGFSTDDKHLNDLLLSLEKKCKCLGKPSKLKVYEYLASVANCKKETLLSHSKSLVLQNENDRIKHLILRLSVEIEQIMPKSIARYEEECQQVALQKKLNCDDPTKQVKIPRRRCQWSDAAKKLVQDIMKIKKKCLLFEDKPRNDLDNLLASYLKNNIQILWPEGWMSLQTLIKVYTSAPSDKDVKTVAKETFKDNNKAKQSTSSKPEEVARPIESSIHSEKRHMDDQLQKNIAATICIDDDNKKSINTVKKDSNSFPEVHNHHQDRLNEVRLVDPMEKVTRAPSAEKHDNLADSKPKLPSKSESCHREVPKKRNSYEGDDIQRVMENLKVLQKMSSPYKSESYNSSQVSVITSSKTLSPKRGLEQTENSDGQQQRDSIVNFQEEFQKQFLNSRGHDSLNSKLYHCN